MRTRAPILLLALLGGGCATSAVDAAFTAAGVTQAAYCALAPEARAEIRRTLDVHVRIVDCPSDRAGARPRRQGGD